MGVEAEIGLVQMSIAHRVVRAWQQLKAGAVVTSALAVVWGSIRILGSCLLRVGCQSHYVLDDITISDDDTARALLYACTQPPTLPAQLPLVPLSEGDSFAAAHKPLLDAAAGE
jgi:hypothetical protein